MECMAVLRPDLVPEISLLPYTSAEDFLQDFAPGRFALLLLDIYLKDQSGMEAAQTVRAQGEDCPIFFLTTSTEHLLAGYRVFAAGYFLKPIAANRQEFLQTLRHALPSLLNQRQFTVRTATTALSVRLPQILYLDCNNARTVQVHLREQVLTTQDSYADCTLALLTEPDFAECYDHLIVNMDHIASMEADTFLLDTGERIPISRRKKKQVQQAYMLYLARK